jgi:hypothetical protein
MSFFFKDRETSIEIIEEKLKQKLPSFSFKTRGKKILVARKSRLAAAIIFRKKKRIQVSGNFPEFYFSMIFAIFTVLFGILIPVILYFIFIHRKLKKTEKEVVEALKDLLSV